MKKFLLACCVALSFSVSAFAKIPSEVMEPYKAYRVALETGDKAKAKKQAFAAWQAAEEHLGDHKTTGDLAYNYAQIQPTGKEKNQKKNYETRAKTYKRAIGLSSFYKDDAGVNELERRIKFVELELTVRKVRNQSLGSKVSQKNRVGSFAALDDLRKAIDAHGAQGTTYEADMEALHTLYYDANKNPKQAIKHADRALNLYETRTDDLFSPYAYFVRISKGNSHAQLEQKIPAALEYQEIMQNLEGTLPADHQLINVAFRKWMKARADLEDAGRLSEAEAAGVCECWPFEDYKNKPVPIKRVPPVMPRSATRSGTVYVQFDVTDAGQTENIRVISSTERVFEKPALKSVEKWQYSKREPDADPQSRKDISSRVSFKLTNRKGDLIAERAE